MGEGAENEVLWGKNGGKDFEVDNNPRSSWRRVCLIVFAFIVIAGVAVGVGLAVYFKGADASIDLSRSLSVDNIMNHLTELNTIADTLGGGSRSVVDAYGASAEYVISQLEEADFCDIQRQYFNVPIYVQLAPPTLTQTAPLDNISYVVNRDFSGTRYGGNGTYSVSGIAVFAAGGGCNYPQDFQGNFEGNIAVVFDGFGCTQYQKALNAEQARAKAILIVNGRGNGLLNWRVRSVNWDESLPLVQIPVLGLTYSLGLTFQAQETTLHITTSTTVTIENTFNVLCMTRRGNHENIVTIGAHLDSVPEGPGINDNGSGSSSVLEVALEVAKTGFHPTNKILFAWWGAEEIGLLGSRYFVGQLIKQSLPAPPVPFNQTDFLPTLNKNNTLLNLNFDMLGSPNFVRQVYNSTLFPPALNAASHKIYLLFEEFFNQSAIPFLVAEASGGSDYYSFLEQGIPAGGLATGAGSLKTVEQRTMFGGLANAAYDPCYHLSCDTTENIDVGVLQDMSKAAAYVLQKLAEHEHLRTWLNE